jgi:2-iminobutanoate/2-iminopropanoate deaminase
VRRSAVACLTLLVPLAAALPAAAADREVFHLNEQGEKEYNYAQAVRVGDTLYVSGSTGRGETMEEQVRNAYDKLRRTLTRFGADFDDVVKETVFTTDIEALKNARAVRREFYGEHTPASSWIGIDRLFVPGLMIEVEIVAVLEKKKD